MDVTRVGKTGGSAHILEEIELSRALFEIYEGGVVRDSYSWSITGSGNPHLPVTVHSSRFNLLG